MRKVLQFKPKIPTEYQECKAFFLWCENNLELSGLVAHIPNEAKRSYGLARLLQCIGLRKGICDYIIPISRGGHGLMFLEMKRRDKKLSKISPDQKLWIEKMQGQGHVAVIAWGWDDAAKQVQEYLALGK